MSDSFNAKSSFKSGTKTYTIYRLDSLKQAADITRLPFSIRILLENLLRNEDGKSVRREDIEALAKWDPKKPSDKEIAFSPARVVLQDFTGVPCVVDLAVMRDAIRAFKGDPKKINPMQNVDLVIDHSVQVDTYGSAGSFGKNTEIEFDRNRERYEFLKWGQRAFHNFRVVPPGTGIVHQVNLEYLASVVMAKVCHSEAEGRRISQSEILRFAQDDRRRPQDDLLAYPDTVVGTDSHTTMINGLGVLGWGVGGIEAEAAMLGQPISMLIPEVVGFKLAGSLAEGVTATDLVLTVTQMLRKKGVVGKFVEFFGPGLDQLSLADRATVANMAPEYGATMGFFPVDEETLRYLEMSGRDKGQIELVRAYLTEQGIFRTRQTPDPVFSGVLELDLKTVEPSLAGPKRPQDRVRLADARKSFYDALPTLVKNKEDAGTVHQAIIQMNGASAEIKDGAVVIAAITSCTNTSNPSVMIGAGLLAKKAVERGLQSKPWVKTSLAPGSKVVMDYLEKTGVKPALEALKFYLVGYGCTTCIGNSGPLPEPVEQAVKANKMVVVSVLSGNRNFEGRVNPSVRANYLASPPLVVAYALAGTMDIDLTKDAIGNDQKGKPVYLRDIWPSAKEVRDAAAKVDSAMFRKQYADVFEGDRNWKAIQVPAGDTFAWEPKSTYIRKPTYFDGIQLKPAPLRDITGARVLVMVGDSVTTDHISPAGSIQKDGPAGKYLIANGVDPNHFNSYGARRGNHEVMVRGTFANVRLRNLIAPGTEGGVTRHLPDGAGMSIFDAAMQYQKEKVPLLVMAGKEYGSGSSRDWAAKGPALLGVRAVIAESFERIHRSNLIGMGILPLEFKTGETRESLRLTGEEVYAIDGIQKDLKPGKMLTVRAGQKQFTVRARIDTPVELAYYQHGGILQYVLRQLIQ